MATSNQVAPEKSSPITLEEERREFEAVAASLANSSRLLQLMTYIGEKYFRGETGQLQEYNIATEVFGRSRTTFNPGEDAIVRVEFHRLRKRLKEYYETEGKDHPLQLVVPPGTYGPVFVRRTAHEEQPSLPSPPPAPVVDVAPFPQKRRLWIYVAAAALVLAVLGSYQISRGHRGEKDRALVPASAVPAASQGNNAAFAEVPLRILAGYAGKPQIDSAGEVWQPDQFFSYGGNMHAPGDLIGRTSNPMLFEHWRTGQFSYYISLRQGVYELHLYFMATDRYASGPSTFSVLANGKPLLPSLDIYSDAMGAYIADEHIFRDITPGDNGILRLDFMGERVTAELNAIEVLPGTPHRQLPVRLVMQPRSLTDHSGQFWHPDDYYLGGYSSAKQMPVSGTSDPDMYAAERYGHFSYAIPVDTRDRYTLVLHFAELYFGPNAPGAGGTGSRVFRVLCNGNTLLDNFDIYNEAGSLHALTRTFYHLRPTAQGKLNITFEPIVNNATVSAIEVLDESQ